MKKSIVVLVLTVTISLTAIGVKAVQTVTAIVTPHNTQIELALSELEK